MNRTATWYIIMLNAEFHLQTHTFGWWFDGSVKTIYPKKQPHCCHVFLQKLWEVVRVGKLLAQAPCVLSLTHRLTHTNSPVWVFESVGSGQVSSEVMSQQHHFFQSHLLPPFFQRFQELLLSPLRISAELGTAAPAEAQKVQSVDWPAAGKRVQVLGPKSNSAPKAMQQNQRRPGVGRGLGERWGAWLCLIGKRQGPQIVAVGYPNVLPGERPVHTCSRWEGGREGGRKWVILTTSNSLELFIRFVILQ